MGLDGREPVEEHGDVSGEAQPKKRRKKRAPAPAVPNPAPSPYVGLLLKVAAVAMAIGVGVELVWVFLAPAGSGSLAGQAGANVGSVIGAVVAAGVMTAVCYWLFQKGREISDPERFAPAALDRGRLEHLADALADHQVADARPHAGEYKELSDEQLAGVHDAIDRERAAAKFDELVREIRKRTRRKRSARASVEGGSGRLRSCDLPAPRAGRST